MAKIKTQRIRDPVHNLIEFGADKFEETLWRAVQTVPFQRLRRVRQLGFSELVFPGATHTRFAHSIGVFHTARLLMQVIERYLRNNQEQFNQIEAWHAQAAALLHDVGHGMFSHAFEAVGKEFGWPMAHHEKVSEILIRTGEIKDTLDGIAKGFADNVADMIAQSPTTLYGSVVSSQFDADRLDYMQRDRIMTGVQSSSVDLTWLLANLEVGKVQTGADDTLTGTIETLVLGPKALHAAESYVLALFHLYPNVYFHKTTRGAELVFQALIRRIVHLHNDGKPELCGLPIRHPILRFVEDPGNLNRALALDDTVFWGALPMLLEADDIEIQRMSYALRDRRLARCIDLRRFVDSEMPDFNGERHQARAARVTLACESIAAALSEKAMLNRDGTTRFLVDKGERAPYKLFQDSQSPLNQILIRVDGEAPRDVARMSPAIAHAEPFNLCRAYMFRDDKEADSVIKNIARIKLKES